jgi:hypothetical protein
VREVWYRRFLLGLGEVLVEEGGGGVLALALEVAHVHQLEVPREP